jgi:hypothetical protein
MAEDNAMPMGDDEEKKEDEGMGSGEAAAPTEEAAE